MTLHNVIDQLMISICDMNKNGDEDKQNPWDSTYKCRLHDQC